MTTAMVECIVVMGHAFHTQDVVPRIIDEINKMNHDGSLPPGVKVVPFYDRMSLVHVTTPHGPGESPVRLRPRLLDPVDLPRRSAGSAHRRRRPACSPTCLLHHHPGAARRGCESPCPSARSISASSSVRRSFSSRISSRNFQRSTEKRQDLLEDFAEEQLGSGVRASNKSSIPCPPGPIGCASSISAPCRSTGRCCSPWRSPSPRSCRSSPCRASRVRSSVPWPRTTAGMPLVGAVITDVPPITPVLSSILLPEHVKEVETSDRAGAAHPTIPLRCIGRSISAGSPSASAPSSCWLRLSLATRLGSEFLPALEEGNYWIRLSMPPTMGLAAGTEGVKKIREILPGHPQIITALCQHGRPDNDGDPSPFSNVELFVPLKPHSEWPAEVGQGPIDAQHSSRSSTTRCRATSPSFLAEHPGQHRRGHVGRQGASSRPRSSWPATSRNSNPGPRGQRPDQASPGHGGCGHVSRRGATEPQHHGRPAKRRPLWPQHGRRECRHSGGDGQSDRDHASRRRPLLERHGSPGAEVLRQRRGRRRCQRSAIRTPPAPRPFPLRELATISLDTGASTITTKPCSVSSPVKFSVPGSRSRQYRSHRGAGTHRARTSPCPRAIGWSGRGIPRMAAKPSIGSRSSCP